MALILSCRGKSPEFGKNCWLAPNATVVGDVKCGDGCSFWFTAVVRGDVNSIILGNNVNVQDGAVIHCTFNKTTVEIGDNVSIGHNAIVHGATIANDVLIGMGAVVMDGCKIGSGVILAAGAVLLENTQAEEGYIYAGVPAKKIKPVPENLRKGEIERIANSYKLYASWFQ
ncbi:MAG: gamma carbonic anhydrase family protein [Crocinitomicaceae bacterium]|nr:gamma carbonic anhydrase family protein [Crocinitomicaceae bacterium]